MNKRRKDRDFSVNTLNRRPLAVCFLTTHWIKYPSRGIFDPIAFFVPFAVSSFPKTCTNKKMIVLRYHELLRFLTLGFPPKRFSLPSSLQSALYHIFKASIFHERKPPSEIYGNGQDCRHWFVYSIFARRNVEVCFFKSGVFGQDQINIIFGQIEPG